MVFGSGATGGFWLMVLAGCGVALLVFGCAASSQRDGVDEQAQPVVPDGFVRIEVVDHSDLYDDEHAEGDVAEREPLYLASSANGWDPGAQPSDGFFVDGPDGAVKHKIRPGGDRAAGWYFMLPVEEAERMAFKFTRGSWQTVEVGMNGQDIQNRVMPRLTDKATGEPMRVVRLELAGFVDQRGDRWPNLAAPGEPPAPSVTGTLEVTTVPAPELGGDRVVRVWLPQSYASSPDRAYPVLYMHDGQNCFDNATASFGVEWGCDETATELASSGVIPEMIIVGIDNSPNRSAEYNAPSARFRGITPVGDKYADWLIEDLMPWVEANYRVKTGPEHTALGGSSFGGNITLYTMMRHPGVFGRALVESPAVPVVGPAFMDEIRAHTGGWAERVFVAMGTQETGNEAYNRELVGIMGELRKAFEDDDLTEANGRLMVIIEEGAAHNEAAWAGRLDEAFAFLFGG